MSECLACTGVGPGGLIAESEHWLVDHCVGPLGVGTLIVKPRRHVLGVGELDADEAAELGPLLRRVAAAVEELAAPSQVYVCLWSHQGHIHFVVQPVSDALMSELDTHGPRLQAMLFERGELPDPAAAAEFAVRARALLASP